MGRPRASALVLARRGDLVVERDLARPSGRLLRQAGMDASYVDLADPMHLEFDYLRWIRLVLRAFRTDRVLHIGGAGCSLARALAAEHRGGGRQEVSELDAEVLELAREHLGLRRAEGLRVRHTEGRAHLERQPENGWDAVVIDAFVGAKVPACLVSAPAVAEAARVAPLVLVNVVDDRSAGQVGAVAAALAGTLPCVWTLGGRGAGNTIVAGAVRTPDLVQALARVAAGATADRSPARLRTGDEVARLVAGVAPLPDQAPPLLRTLR